MKAEGIPWPLTEDGRLSTEAKVFEDMSKGHAQLEGLRQLKHIRDKMRSVELAVGADDRNRTVLWPFKAKSGRTQPAASEVGLLARRLDAQPDPARRRHGDFVRRLFVDGVPDRGGEVRAIH